MTAAWIKLAYTSVTRSTKRFMVTPIPWTQTSDCHKIDYGIGKGSPIEAIFLQSFLKISCDGVSITRRKILSIVAVLMNMSIIWHTRYDIDLIIPEMVNPINVSTFDIMTGYWKYNELYPLFFKMPLYLPMTWISNDTFP